MAKMKAKGTKRTAATMPPTGRAGQMASRAARGVGQYKAGDVPTRSMPDTSGAQAKGGHSFGGSTIPRLADSSGKSSGPMIAPSKKGAFTAKAKAAGMSVQAYAAHVLAAKKGTVDPDTVRQANFARNFGGASKARARK